jgi:class 3 adenylate cyclase/tetratricopeptide (TPR) repeat protein
LVPDEEQRKLVTVLFADVTGSTTLGERTEPETLRRMLARFFDAARSVVKAHGGTVEKFIGDAVMAVFGVPVAHEDDALRALRAALELMSALETVNGDLLRDHGAALQIRIGVNSGDVVTGTSERLATGDAVNLAARLEQRAAPGEIYVGELTMQLAGSSATFVELQPALVKGKAMPVRVFRLASAASTARPVRATPMVGRKRQLELLRAAFDRADTERVCVLFTVLGAAGVGKSRLVDEFLAGLDATVVRGRCLSYGTGVGLLPIVEIVRQVQDGPAAAEVAALLEDDDAVAAAVRALVATDVAGAPGTEIAWGVRKLLERAATTRSLVIVIDDLHWAEAPLFELIEHTVTLSRDAPIMIAAMARPELLERREGWGAGALNSSTMLLEPLGREESAELVDLLSTSLDAAARDRVRLAAAGNPLFAEELVALVEASGGADVRVPPSIHALLAARLDQLHPAERRALERGSVEGQTFHHSAVAALIPDDPDLPARLLGLVRKDLLRPDRPTIGRDEAFQFRHLLLRDAAYERLTKLARAELHERFARWLDQRATELPERDSLVGYHLEQAYRYRRALGPLHDAARALATEAAARLETAGRRQMARDDLPGAMDLLDRASSLAPQEQPNLSLELGVAACLNLCGRPEDAVARAAATADAATRRGDRIGSLLAEVVGALIALGIDTARSADLQRLLDRAMPEFEAAGNDSARAWCWWAIGELAHLRCRFGDALEANVRVREYAERGGDHFLTFNRNQVASYVAWGPTPIPQALQVLEDMRIEFIVYNPWIDVFRAKLLALDGRIDEARALYNDVVAAFRERGMHLAAGISGQFAWEIEMAAGDVDGAIAIGFASCAELERMGERVARSTNAAQLAEALYLNGRDHDAGEWSSRALELGAEDDALTQAQARMVRALLCARHGHPDKAVPDMRQALAITADMQMPIPQGRAALYAATMLADVGDKDAAGHQLRRALDHFTTKGSTVYMARAAEALAAAGH